MRLKELRLNNHKTQKEVADFINVKQNSYSQYESGQREIPISQLIKLALYYKVSVDYLLDLTDIETPYPKI